MRNFCIKRPDGVLARIVVHPTGAAFDHYVIVEEADVVKFKLWVCTLEVAADQGESGVLMAKWKTSNELLIRIPSQQSEISVYVDECRAMVRRQAKPFVTPFDLTSRRSVRSPLMVP